MRCMEGEKSEYRKREIFTAANTIPFLLDGKEIASIPVAELLP